MQKKEKSYFHSKVFIRLFLSYALIIIVFLTLYTGTFLFSYSSHHRSIVEREMQQKTAAWATAMDQQLLAAQSACSAVNTSESSREVLYTAYAQGKTIDSMQLYKMLNELKRIKGSSANMHVYNLMLSLNGDDKLYTGGSVISVEGTGKLLDQYPYIGVTTASVLLGVKSNASMMVNKPFLIYADDYTPNGSTAKGSVLVLLEQSGLRSLTEDALGDAAGACLSRSGEQFFRFGEIQGQAFAAESMVIPGLTYQVYAKDNAFALPVNASLLTPVLLMALLGFAFLTVTYHLSKRYYKPIDNIGQMIERNGSSDEMDEILEGVRSLIGERNGYRERMITISPYARRGMLHSLLSGDLKHLEVLTNEQFIGLRKAYYMLAVVNVAGSDVTMQQYLDAQELIVHACREMSADEYSITCFAKNPQNLFVIVGSDDDVNMEEQFYKLHQRCIEALDDKRYAVTIGVSRLENDLEALRDACADAEQALEQMLTGGRSSVYFYETAQIKEARPYFFPKDAQRRIAKGLKEGNLSDLEAMLEEIYTRNVKEAELPMAEIRMMVDELHFTIRNALREVSDMSTTHIQIERIREAATIEEIFTYYRTVFAASLNQRENLAGAGEERKLGQEICAYILMHCCDPDLSLNSVADHFGVSTKMVGLICKDTFGKTYLQYVRDLQIQRAASLLQTTDATLEEIAQQCGFANLLTFRRNFKAVMGMNPSDYRK
ncbi:MAG: helix-turn-helix transcriptional regulator [Clostridia bacterium]|nr:helix-turn-helix transcriptional regulator [Clostridia bacterium]